MPVQRATAHRVKVLAGNGRHDQGVLADIVAPRMAPVAEFLDGLGDGPAAVLVLDRLTNPANVGMILRSATAAGLDGVLLPRRGLPSIDPLMIKASAGVAFRAPVLRSATVEDGCAELAAAGFTVFGLDAGGSSLLDAELPDRVALVLGNETDGLSASVRPMLDGVLAIPMYGGVESLGVASAGAVAAFELARRRHHPRADHPTPGELTDRARRDRHSDTASVCPIGKYCVPGSSTRAVGWGRGSTGAAGGP